MRKLCSFLHFSRSPHGKTWTSFCCIRLPSLPQSFCWWMQSEHLKQKHACLLSLSIMRIANTAYLIVLMLYDNVSYIFVVLGYSTRLSFFIFHGLFLPSWCNPSNIYDDCIYILHNGFFISHFSGYLIVVSDTTVSVELCLHCLLWQFELVRLICEIKPDWEQWTVLYNPLIALHFRWKPSAARNKRRRWRVRKKATHAMQLVTR